MGVVALVMAGGKSARIGPQFEKPLIRICGRTMIKRVIEVLRSSKNIDDIVVATSEFTPKTAELMRNSSIKVVETPGVDYCTDMRYAIKECALFFPVLVVSADLPLITKELIDYVIAHYRRCGKPALAVMIPAENYEKLGLRSEYLFKVRGRLAVPVGINVIDGRYVDKPRIAEKILILDKAELVVNVNTWGDLKIVEKLLAETGPRSWGKKFI